MEIQTEKALEETRKERQRETVKERKKECMFENVPPQILYSSQVVHITFRKTFFIFDTFQFILAAKKGFSLFQKLTQTEAPSGQVIKPQKLGHIFKEKEI